MSVETLEIEDNVSPKLAHIATGATQAAQSLADLQKTLDRIMPGSGLEKLRTELLGVDAELEKLRANASRGVDVDVRMHKSGGGGGLGDLLGGGGGGEGAAGAEGAGAAGAAGGAAAGAVAAIAALKVALDVAKEVVRTVVEIGVSFTKTAIEEAAFANRAQSALEYLTGSSAMAEQLYEQVEGISAITGESVAGSLQRMQKLLADGFNENEALRVMHDLADIAAIRGDAAATRVERVLEQMKETGSASSKMIDSLARAGIDRQDVIAKIASETHKSIAQVEQDLKHGAVTADEATRAIQESLEHRYGGAAEKLAKDDPFAQFRSMALAAGDLFKGIDLSAIANTFAGIGDVLKGDAGQDLKSAFHDLFGNTFEALFGEFTHGDAKAKIADTIHSIANGVRNAASVIKDITPIVQASIGAILSIVRAGAGAMSVLSDVGAAVSSFVSPAFDLLAAGLRKGTEIFDAVSGRVGQFIDAFKSFDISKMDGALSGLFSDIIGFGDEIGNDLLSVGTRMIDGLVNGIVGGAARVVDSLVSVCTSAVKAAERALGIHSPSTVLAEIGSHTAQGFANGIAANDSAPAAASAAMANGAASAAVSGASRVSAAPASGGEVHVNVNTPIVIHANDAKGGADAAEAAAPMIQQAHREAATSYWRTWKEAG